MKLSFLPGDLHLSQSPNGYVLMRGKMELFRTSSERAAVARFKQVRADMEANGFGPTKNTKPAGISATAAKNSPAKINNSRQPKSPKNHGSSFNSFHPMNS